MSAEKNDSAKVLERLIRLCDDLAWGRPADENALSANSKVFPEPLTVELLKKHQELSESCK